MPDTQPETVAEELSQLPLPPGVEGLPLLGETLAFLRAPGPFLDERRRRHGDIFRSHLFGSPTVFLSGAEASRWVFGGENKFLHVRWGYGTRRVLGLQAIPQLTGEAHQARRRLLAPHFTQAVVRDFVPRIQTIATRHLERWAGHPEVTVLSVASTLVLEVALGLILGDTPVDMGRVVPLVERWVKGLFSAVPWDVPFTVHGRSMAARRELRALLERVVAGREHLAEQPRDILGSLLSVRDEEGQPLPREAVLDETLVQLLAGHDTTLHSLTNLVWMLAEHPEVLQRCHEEQWGAGVGEPLTLERLKEMPYLHQVIHEVLRHLPPVSALPRVTTRDVAYGGYRIPRGWTLMLSVGGTHRSSPWTAPERFDPERMGPERAEHRKQSNALIPFGGGARVCLGQHFAMTEMAVILALMLRGYRWELVPGQDLSLAPLPFPHPRGGLRVRFARA